MKIKKGDNVIMLGGKDRGKTGKIILVLPVRNATSSVGVKQNDRKVVVEGLNLIKKHVRARKQGQKGQIISKERAVSVSSVSLVCKSCRKPTRVGYKIKGDNKVRICKKCKDEV